MLEFNATFIVAMLSFVVFIMIMNAIFYRPILNIIRKREDYMNANYEKSKELEKSADEYTQIRNDKISKTQEKCRKELAAAVEKIQTAADVKINQAKENTKHEIQNKKDDLNKQKVQLQQTVNQTVTNDLASIISDKITEGIIK